jgi:flagellar hook-length control protein FliK
VNGATILPFPPVPGAAAPGRSNASATGGRLAGPVFSDAMDGALDAPAPLRRDDHGRASKPRLLVHEPRPSERAKPATPAARRSNGGARKTSGASKAGYDDESTHDVDEAARGDRKAGSRDDVAANRDATVRAADRDADGVNAAGSTDSATESDQENGASTSPVDGAESAERAGTTDANVTGVAVLVDQATADAAGAKDTGPNTADAKPDTTRTARILRWAGVAAQEPTETSAAQAAKSDTAQRATVPTDPAAQGSTAPSTAQSATAAPDTLAAMIAAAAEAARVRALAQTSASTVVPAAGEDSPATEEPASGAAIEAIEAAPVASEWATAAETAAATEPRGGAASGSDARKDGESQQRPQTPAARGSEATAFAVAASADGARFTLNVGAATAAYGSAASAGPGREEPVLPQLVQNIRMQASQGVSEARVQLRPEHLGALNITLKIENGQVTATIQAEVPAVRQWIESNESSLRQALLEQGLELNRLVVHPDGEAPSGEGQDQEAPRRQPRRQSWRDESMTFEVIA